jgi:hypothetical protein
MGFDYFTEGDLSVIWQKIMTNCAINPFLGSCDLNGDLFMSIGNYGEIKIMNGDIPLGSIIVSRDFTVKSIGMRVFDDREVNIWVKDYLINNHFI